MTNALSALGALIVLIASIVAVYLVTRSKRVEAALDVLGQLVDSLTKGNKDLREEAEAREARHVQNRAADRAECDRALAAERAARTAENLACAKDIAELQGKVNVLTTNIAEVIATAVLKTIEHSGESATVATTVATTTTRPATQGDK